MSPQSDASPSEADELVRLLRNLRYLQPLAQPGRMPKWTPERSYQLWAIAWRHRLPAPRRAPTTESTTARLPAPRRP